MSDDLAVVDDGEAVTESVRFLEVVRGQEDRRPEVAESADLLPEVGSVLRVEARRGLVQEQDVGLVHDA